MYSSTHTIVGFTDEFEKIAAARWRTALRAGELGDNSIARLMVTPRRGGGTLLDHSREVAGLERGTEALAKKHNIPMHVRDPSATKEKTIESLKKGNVREALSTGLKAIKGKRIQRKAAPGGGAIVDNRGRVLLDPENPGVESMRRTAKSVGKDLKDVDKDALNAMLKRHEVREAIEKKKVHNPKNLVKETLMLKRPGRVSWPSVKRTPKNEAQKSKNIATRNAMLAATKTVGKAQASVGKVVGGGLESIGRRAKKYVPSAGKLESTGSRMKGVSKSYAKDVGRQAEDVIPIDSKGNRVVARHMSPAPILEESHSKPMMPSLPQYVMEKSRFRPKGEASRLASQGVDYNVAPTKQQRKRVMKAWSNYEM